MLTGTSEALPKRGFVLKGRHDIRVRILPEIPYESFADMSTAELTESVRRLFLHELGEREDVAAEDAAVGMR